MSPGPKRKGRKDYFRSGVKQTNAATPGILSANQGEVKQNEPDIQNDSRAEIQCVDDGVKNGRKRYSKRQIQSNWDRYEEPTPGILEDTLRGESFEVLASYQGGSDSYLKLKEEKEWGNTKDFQDDLYLDCDELAQSLKCISLHKRLHIPEDYFTPEMLQKFKDAAERCRSWKLNTQSLSSGKDNLPVLSLLSNSEEVSSETSYTPKPTLISEKTENIILSLTNCSSLKDESVKTVPKAEESPAQLTSNDTCRSSPPKQETQETHDDLAFLLSLSSSEKNSSDVTEDKGSSASIEDWLNELLAK